MWLIMQKERWLIKKQGNLNLIFYIAIIELLKTFDYVLILFFIRFLIFKGMF